MFKGFAVMATFLLLLSSGVVVANQWQHYGLDQTNYAGLLGEGAAGSINMTTTGVEQLSTGGCHTTDYQNTVGSLVQAAGAVGMCGVFDVCQYGSASGWQGECQTPGVIGTDVQVQDLDADLVQSVNKVGGQGSALGLQTFVGVQNQLSFNPWGGSANVQGIGVSLYDAVGGGPGSATNVAGAASFGAGQY